MRTAATSETQVNELYEVGLGEESFIRYNIDVMINQKLLINSSDCGENIGVFLFILAVLFHLLAVIHCPPSFLPPRHPHPRLF